MIDLAHEQPVRIVRAVVFHIPGRGFVTVPPGTQTTAFSLDKLSPTIRRAVVESARRDEETRGVQMVLVTILGQPRLMDSGDIDDVARHG